MNVDLDVITLIFEYLNLNSKLNFLLCYRLPRRFLIRNINYRYALIHAKTIREMERYSEDSLNSLISLNVKNQLLIRNWIIQDSEKVLILACRYGNQYAFFLWSQECDLANLSPLTVDIALSELVENEQKHMTEEFLLLVSRCFNLEYLLLSCVSHELGDFVRILLKLVNSNSAFLRACRLGNLEIVSMFQPSKKIIFEGLVKACKYANCETVRYLLRRCSAKHLARPSLLRLACEYGSIDIIDNQEKKLESFHLRIAILANQLQAGRFILSRGIKLTDNVMLASLIAQDNIKWVKLLLNYNHKLSKFINIDPIIDTRCLSWILKHQSWQFTKKQKRKILYDSFSIGRFDLFKFLVKRSPAHQKLVDSYLYPRTSVRLLQHLIINWEIFRDYIKIDLVKLTRIALSKRR